MALVAVLHMYKQRHTPRDTPTHKKAQYLHDHIHLADVSEELVAQPGALTGALHQPRDVHELHGRGHRLWPHSVTSQRHPRRSHRRTAKLKERCSEGVEDQEAEEASWGVCQERIVFVSIGKASPVRAALLSARLSCNAVTAPPTRAHSRTYGMSRSTLHCLASPSDHRHQRNADQSQAERCPCRGFMGFVSRWRCSLTDSEISFRLPGTAVLESCHGISWLLRRERRTYLE